VESLTDTTILLLEHALSPGEYFINTIFGKLDVDQLNRKLCVNVNPVSTQATFKIIPYSQEQHALVTQGLVVCENDECLQSLLRNNKTLVEPISGYTSPVEHPINTAWSHVVLIPKQSTYVMIEHFSSDISDSPECKRITTSSPIFIAQNTRINVVKVVDDFLNTYTSVDVLYV
jgi:hypothetical protein